MSRFLNCCLTSPISREVLDSEASGNVMEKKSNNNVTSNSQSEKQSDNFNGPVVTSSTNIIFNHDFSEGLHFWHPNCCEGSVMSSDFGQPLSGRFAAITKRNECWQGLEQDITARVCAGLTYTVSALVGISGAPQGFANVLATLKLEHQDSSVSYVSIARTIASMGQWGKIEGTFSLSTVPKRVIFYLEGPSPGIDLLIRSVVISCPSSSRCDSKAAGPVCDGDDNIILNPTFNDGLNNWSGRGCDIELHDSMDGGKILPMTGKVFASTKNRTQNWNGIEQEITGRVQRKLAYNVTANVRIFGNNSTSEEVRATLYVLGEDKSEQYIGITSVQATDQSWAVLQGKKFLINSNTLKVVIYLEGPPPGTDILLDNMVVNHAPDSPSPSPPIIENPAYGVNTIANSNLSDGTNGWFALGNCTLKVASGSPRIQPSMAAASLGPHMPLSGLCILATNRTQTWMGPAQMITDKLVPFVTYQVSGWGSIGKTPTQPQNVNIALSVDGQWVNGGQVDIIDSQWYEFGGSFRIEKQATQVMIYVQGPDAGIDLMVGGLNIFAVDRSARFKHLKVQTDKIRKRDVTLKFTVSDSSTLAGANVLITQVQNSFPLGSCISRSTIDNEDFVDFFTKNFNWAVFGNELKWYWTEPQQGTLNYGDADAMLAFCESNSILPRGHCIFWEVESTVQQWVRALSKTDLAAAVQNRLSGLLTRYNGKFRHYDVNNEMLHGSFYQDRLGSSARADMFKGAAQLDPSATLFVNDYHVEDGCDWRSSPEKYTAQILGLQEQGAPVGGVGLQGHIVSPVGPIVQSALDKLGRLGLPIWFTEVDVSSTNEYVRADDLEVMLREVYAHPAVEGVVLWGFWELFMSRENAHLVDAEGRVNVAGQRFLKLKQEWLTKAHGRLDEECKYSFRGFHGSYQVEVVTGSKKKVVKTFEVEAGVEPILINISL